MREEAFNGLRIEEIGVVFEREAQAFGVIGDREGQIEFRACVVEFFDAAFNAAEPDRGRGRVVEHEHDLKQRRTARTAFGMQCGD